MKAKHFITLVMTLASFRMMHADIDRSLNMTDQEIDKMYGLSARERGAASQREALKNIEQNIHTFSGDDVERIAYYGESLRKLAKQNIYQVRESISTYDKIQKMILHIPGHADYFGKRIRDAYEPLKGDNPAIAINPAQTEMMYGFATLKQLPSPETVKVLGGMLSETWQMPSTGDYTPPALAKPSMIALGDLSIRNAPWKPIQTTNDMPGAIPAWQAWWEEVKSGKRTFSFKGQAVEYRFKPDGTWETHPISNPPDDGPKPVLERTNDRPNKQSTSAQANSTMTISDSLRWFGIGGLVLLAVGAWLWRKKQNG